MSPMVFLLHRRLASAPRQAVAALCFLLIPLLGMVDHLTGHEVSFSIFYLIPLAAATWYCGRSFGLAACLIAAGTWLCVDLTGGRVYSMPCIPYWNALVRLGFFLTTVSLLLVVKRYVGREKLLARTDPLTGVHNRRAFDEWLSHYLHIGARHKESFALGYIDLDNFKQINDTAGHDTGDQVLCSVASVLVSSLRDIDIVGRLGGDEFVVLLPKTDCQRAVAIFDRLHQELLSAMRTSSWPVGFSIGAAVFLTMPETTEQALKIVDNLMFHVKRNGRNSVVLKVIEEASGQQDDEKISMP